MCKIAIIGAGLSGLTVANLLKEYADIHIIEKSRGPGGRMATRNADPYYFDHGAQFFKARSPDFKSFINPMINAGVIARWDAKFVEIVNGEINFSGQWTEEYPHYVGVPGMNAIGQYLTKQHNIEYNKRVVSLEKNQQWTIQTENTSALENYDWVISSLPAKQCFELTPENTSFKALINTESMQACYSLMLGFETPLAIDFDAALVRGHDISWLSVNSSKPERNSPYCLLVHSTNQWANNHINDNRDEVLDYLCRQTTEVLNTDISAANHKTLHGWMYANAAKQAADNFLIDEDQQIAACGDWLIHGRVEAAFLSGYQLANRLKEIIS